MTLDPARRLEVLREWLAEGFFSPPPKGEQRREALSDAIKAVEREHEIAKRFRAFVIDAGSVVSGYGWHIREIEAVLAPPGAAPESSTESLQERVEALVGGLRSLRGDMERSKHGGPWDPLAAIRRINDLLHPHASHCNTEHEGACGPGEGEP